VLHGVRELTVTKKTDMATSDNFVSMRIRLQHKGIQKHVLTNCNFRPTSQSALNF
jgi:hypothetical protein